MACLELEIMSESNIEDRIKILLENDFVKKVDKNGEWYYTNGSERIWDYNDLDEVNCNQLRAYLDFDNGLISKQSLNRKLAIESYNLRDYFNGGYEIVMTLWIRLMRVILMILL